MKQVMEIGVEGDLQLPPIEKVKAFKTQRFWSVIVVVGKMVEGNALFSNLEPAEAAFIQQIKENVKPILTNEEINSFINEKFVIGEKASVFLDQPTY